MKNRYLFISAVLLLVLLAAAVWFFAKLGIEPAESDFSYKDEVFNQKKVSVIDIQIDESNLKKILESPLEKEVVPANVVFNGKKIENVGFRTKGNMTLRSVAQMEDSDRYSFKIDFDYYKDGQNLYGLKKMALNNNYTDSTMSKEFVSYKLMEQMGVPTPANSYMYITINGEDWGLYLGVEAVEETFLASAFDDPSGDLYKPDGVGSDLKWISDDIDDYSGLDLKTNKEGSSQTAMIKFLDVINNGGNLEDVMDVDEMLRYFAVNTALVNLDHYQGSMKHNYYLYEENGKFSIIPWDYNMSFGGFGGDMGGGPNGGDQNQKSENMELPEGLGNMAQGMGDMMSESTINFSITEPVSGTTMEERPLLNALLSNEKYREKYESYLAEMTESFFTEDNMKNIMGGISAMILPYVEKDPTKFTTTEQFLEGVAGENSLVEFAVQRAESINKQLSGELVVKAEQSGGKAVGGERPPREFNDGNRPPMPEGMEEGEFPELPFEGQEGEGHVPPDGEFMNGQMPKGMKGGPPRSGESGNGSGGMVSGKWMIFVMGSLFLLSAAIVFVFRFRRRGV